MKPRLASLLLLLSCAACSSGALVKPEPTRVRSYEIGQTQEATTGSAMVRVAMQSRHAAAQQLLEDLIRDITTSARVLQGGGAEVFGDSLVKKLETAANAALAVASSYEPVATHE